LDLLELRLETLDSVVDYFIISESTKTHSGLDKPLYFNENKNRFKKFEYKIIHQIIDFTPNNYNELVDIYNKAKLTNSKTSLSVCEKIFNADWFNKDINSYLRDTFEKEALLYAFTDCHVQDTSIVLLGDLDEIPRPETVEHVLEEIIPNDKNENNIYHLQHDMFYYYLNLQKTNEPWFGTILTSLNNFKKYGFCYMRTYKPGNKILNGGWHFTYQGGVEMVKTKVRSWGEQSLNRPYVVENIERSIEKALEDKKDLFFRNAEFVVRDIDDGTFPTYLAENKEKFRDMIYDL
jgi:beta-1,4-mannosyl-glycoprotein beta-1,4-N-acetylglucosaminyltransferase